MRVFKNIYKTIHKLIKHITILKINGISKYNMNKSYDSNLFEIMLLPQQKINQLESYYSHYSIDNNIINYVVNSSKSIVSNIYENEGTVDEDLRPLPYFYLAKVRIINNKVQIYETKSYQINNVSYIALNVSGGHYWNANEYGGVASFDIYVNDTYYDTSIREHPQHVLSGSIWGGLNIYIYSKENKNYTIEIRNIKYEGYCKTNSDTFFYITGYYKRITNKENQQGTLIIFEKY